MRAMAEDNRSDLFDDSSSTEETNAFLSPKVANIIRVSLLNVSFGIYFAWATYRYIYLEKNHDGDSSSKANASDAAYCLGYCGIQWCDGHGLLLLLTVFTYIGLIYYKLFKPKFGAPINRAILKPMNHLLTTFLRKKIAAFGIVCLIVVGLILFIYFDTMDSRERIQSLLGISILYGFGYVFSTNRSKINWRPVICGTLFQFLFAVFCIRLEIGRKIITCVGNKVSTFLNYAVSGSTFVFGKFLIDENVFAFAVLPVIFFFSFIISVLYYWNVMQWIVGKLGWMLQSILGTTVCESVVTAGNIFLGMTEAPLLIRPYIQYLTASEMHAVMAGGFATISGTVFAAYTKFGANASYLFISSVMSAPASLAFSKLFYPEEEVSKTKSDNIQVEKSNGTSTLDAACNGALAAIPVVLGIIANMVAFVSFVAYINGAFRWLGYLIGYDNLSFEWIFAKIFFPLAYILGVRYEDCENVAKIIAEKTTINESVAFKHLGEANRSSALNWRSSAIATFAICGFANLGSMGVLIGCLSSMCPQRRTLVLKVSFRAFVSGCVVCFINASVAGLLLNADITASK